MKHTFSDINQTSPLRNRRSNKAFPEMEFHTVVGAVCLKFPGNDAVRTDYDYSRVPFLWFVSLGKQRNEQKRYYLKSIIRSGFLRKHNVINLFAGIITL